ncbi:MAG: CapK related-protein [Phycisphaerales bacterium]|nr:CapK related-protein [Phycisphaerales bacterium]
MQRFIHRHVLLPAFEGLYKRRRTFSYLKELERSQWLGKLELDAIQFRGLQLLLSHAFENSDYYRREWQELGLNPRTLSNFGDFSRWPVIDRGIIRANRERMRSRGSGRLISKSTGGSSGEPLQFDLNLDSNDRRVAASYRGYGWAGVHPGTKQLYLWGVPLQGQRRMQHWKDGFYHRLHRRKYLSTFGLSDERFPQYLDLYNRYRPDAIVAYTSSLYEFARMMELRGIKPFPPRSIVVGAEKLHAFQREVIERVFGCPLFETYGSREFMLVGAECDRHSGLHLTQEQLLVEILDPDGSATRDGEEGDVVITDLFNYGMPFIRYRTGDRAIAGLERCACGRGLPLLKGVTGRSMDIIKTPDGRRVSGALFPHLLKDFPAIKRFQVIQDALDHVEMQVVAATVSDHDRQAIERIIRTHLGPAVRFEVQKVSDIALTGAGKLRVVVNKCGESILSDLAGTAERSGRQSPGAPANPPGNGESVIGPRRGIAVDRSLQEMALASIRREDC